jgi:MFS family permease
MTRKQAERNIRLYYWFQLFAEPFFWGPILILFLQEMAHMSLSQILVMESVVVSGLIFLEVPSGALADLIGRKKTIFMGVCLFTIDRVFFTIAFNPLMAWTGNIIWMVGYSLVSGADSAFLCDTLVVLGREDEFRKIQGRAISYRLAAIAVSSVFAGYLAEVHMRLPLAISLVTVFVNCFVVAKFKEPPRDKMEGKQLRDHWQLMKISVLFVANNMKVKWVIAFVVLIGAVSKVWFFTYNPYFVLVGLPVWTFGWIFFALGVIAAVSSYYADWLNKKIGDLVSVVVMILVIGIPIVLMGCIVTKAMAFIILLQNIVRGYIRPFTDHFLNSHLDSKNRATVLSIKSAAGSLGSTMMLGMFGWMVGLYPLPFCLKILGTFTLITGGIIILYYLKIFRRD